MDGEERVKKLRAGTRALQFVEMLLRRAVENPGKETGAASRSRMQNDGTVRYRAVYVGL